MARERSSDLSFGFWGYRPALDGLRAVAVYLAVLFHTGTSRVPGAFVAVDVFLVLSGYLITGVLVHRADRGGGLSPLAFYARRVRRLVPGATFMLVVTSLMWRWLLRPSERADVVDRYQAAFLYVANWDLIRIGTDYFAADPQSNPLLHMWSLAVEAQLYLVWPLVLALAMALALRLPGTPRSTLRFVVVGLALVSLAVALWYQEHDPVRAYYATEARSYQFLLGALVALTPGLGVRSSRHRAAATVASVASFGGLVILATDLVDVGQVHRGAAAALAAAVFVAAVDGAGGWFQAPLRWAPVAYLGRISFGTYLWHWPVMSMVGRVSEPSSFQLLVVGSLVATGMAALSFELIERPVVEGRRLDRRGGTVALLLVAVTLTGVVATPAVIAPRGARAVTEVASSRSGFTPVPVDLDLDRWRLQLALGEGWVDCSKATPRDCTVIEGSGDHLLLLGDSTALSFMQAFRDLAATYDLTLSLAVAPGCPWPEGIRFDHPGALIPCDVANPFFHHRLIPALDPDVIVVVGARFTTDASRTGFDPDSGLDVAMRDAIPRTVRSFHRPDRRVVLIEPMPVAPFDPRACLEEAAVIEECRFAADDAVTWVEDLYRQVDADDGSVWSVDLDGAVCPFLPICDPVVDGMSVRWDGQHLTAGFGASLTTVIERLLLDEGIIVDS